MDKHWLSLKATKPFTDDGLCDYLLETDSRIIVINGPSGSGKTSVIKKLKSKKTVNSVPYNYLVEYICRGVLENPVSDEDFEEKTHGDFFCVEDVDFLCWKSVTQGVTGRLLGDISKECKVIITGIQLKKRVPDLLKNLGGYEEIVYMYD